MPPTARRVVVVGSLNEDTIVRVASLARPGETISALELHREPGGKSSNQATAAALLGADVSMYGVVGADTAGDRLIREASARGVDTTGVRRDETKPTGTAIVMVDDDGENSIIVWSGANDLLTGSSVPASAFVDAPVLVLALESPLEAVIEVASSAARWGCEVLLNASPATTLPRALLDAVTVLVVNRGEVETLTGLSVSSAGWGAVRDALMDLGISRAIVTQGSLGAVVLDGLDVIELGAIPVHTVDTTGCGDAFMGAVAADLAAGRSLREAAQTGISAGAWAAQSLGAQRSFGTRARLSSISVGVNAMTPRPGIG